MAHGFTNRISNFSVGADRRKVDISPPVKPNIESGIALLLIESVFQTTKFCLFLAAMRATAPTARRNKLPVAMALSLVPLAVTGLALFAGDERPSELVSTAILVSVAFGLLVALLWVGIVTMRNPKNRENSDALAAE